MRRGFEVVRALIDPVEATGLAETLRNHGPGPAWLKGRATTSRSFFDLATRPAIIDLVTARLGPDVILWGASLAARDPGSLHAMHTDVETAAAGEGALSIWIGLSGTTRASGLAVIADSHLIGTSVQEEVAARGLRRADATEEAAAGWATARDPRCELVRPPLGDGDAILFDGRLWHGCHHRGDRPRVALLLQFATPATPIRLPRASADRFAWPFQLHDHPRPPCILVRGRDDHGVNELVPPPPAETVETRAPRHRHLWPSWIHPLASPLARDPDGGWRKHPIFRGPTPTFRDLSVHASVLEAGHTPHPPHVHPEEEILLVLSGRVEIVFADETGETRREALDPGAFVYHAANARHTITNPGPEPATYVMWKWLGDPRAEAAPLASRTFRADGPDPATVREPRPGRKLERVLDAPTELLRRLRVHVSTLEPGVGYPPHADDYDVAMVILSGEIETAGRRVGPHGVLYHPAGEPHGLTAVGSEPAVYLVLELHGTVASSARRAVQRLARATRKLILRTGSRVFRTFVPKR